MNSTQVANLSTHHVDFVWSPSNPSALRGYCDGCNTYFDSQPLADMSSYSVLFGKLEINQSFSQFPCVALAQRANNA